MYTVKAFLIVTYSFHSFSCCMNNNIIHNPSSSLTSWTTRVRFFFLMIRRPPSSPLFPSPTLSRPPHFVVQVRAGGEARRADLRDHIAPLHPLAARDENRGAMGVTRHDPAAVIEREHVAVALFPLHVGDDAGGWGLDLGARLRRHVDPLVRAGEVQNRVDAHGREGARDPSPGRHDGRRRRQPLPLLV